MKKAAAVGLLLLLLSPEQTNETDDPFHVLGFESPVAT